MKEFTSQNTCAETTSERRQETLVTDWCRIQGEPEYGMDIKQSTQEILLIEENLGFLVGIMKYHTCISVHSYIVTYMLHEFRQRDL